MKIRVKFSLGMAALVVAFAIPPAQAADSVQQAQQFVRSGQHAKALEMADRLLASNARDPQARFVRGIALAEMNRPDEAITVFHKLTQDFPELPEPYNNLAVLYAQQRQFDKARVALETAIRTHPTYATAHENLGDVYARLASQAYDKALKLDSGNAAAQSKLALIREMMSSGGAGGVARVQAPAPVASRVPAQAPASVATAPTTPAPAPQAASNPPASVATPAPAGAAATTSPAPSAAAPTAAPSSAPAPTASVAPAATPEPTSPAPAKDSAQDRAVLNVAEAWAEAWSRKDVKAYLSHYDSSFRTPRGRPMKEWAREREDRINKPGKISVAIENPRITVNGDRATLRFQQRYNSNNFNASTGKTLELVRRNGAWRIVEERVGS